MDTLGMNNFDSSFDAMQMILTVVAVTAPALIARFQTTQSKALLEDQKKGIVREVIDEFLKNDEKEKKCFYNYDFISTPSNQEGEKLDKTYSAENMNGMNGTNKHPQP